MNPDNNNPLTNPGGDPLGTAGMQGMGGLSMTDSLSSAGDTLTSAGMAVNTAPGAMQLDQLGAMNPEATMVPPVEEPLVPAAPVPGSIGSAMSMPAAAPEMNPMGTPDMFGAPAMPGAGAVPELPTVENPEPAPTQPYNPFAQTADASAANPANVGAGANNNVPGAAPSVAPAAPNAGPFAGAGALPTMAKSAGGMGASFKNPITLVATALAVVFLITTVIFFILWNNAKNNPKLVYVPNPISGEEANNSVELLSCTRQDDLGYLVGDGYSLIGTQDLTASYTGGVLSALGLQYQMTFDNEGDASVAQENFAAQQAGLMETIGGSFDLNYNINGTTLDMSIKSRDGELNEADAEAFLYDTATGDSAELELATVKARYEERGYSCSVE